MVRMINLAAGMTMLCSAGTVSAICSTGIAASTPNTQLIDNGDGTIVDQKTGLMWKSCTEGHVLKDDSTICAGPAKSFNLEEAKQWVAQVNAGRQSENMDYDDWRLPTLEELASIVEQRCTDPAINPDRFVDTFSASYWTSSTYTSKAKHSWVINFSNGEPIHRDYRFKHKVRLVRTLQN